jgi:hypothetical protein
MGTSRYGNMYGVSNPIELDLREEFDSFLNGALDEIDKGQIGMLRKMRRDEDGIPVRCPCRDRQTDEPNRDSYCRFCLGMGFLWDETKIVYYKNEDSFKDGIGFLFYFKYDKDITNIDYVVTLKRNKNGELSSPTERDVLFNINESKTYRSDNGRLEFWQVRALEERKWSTYYGVKNRQR